MDLDYFSEVNRRRCEAPDGFNHPLIGWTTSDWMTALVGEVGEAANIVKKLNRIRDGVPGNSPDLTQDSLVRELALELADIFTYLDLLAQSLGIHMPTAAIEKFNQVSLRIGSPHRIEPQ